jgi:hypothetical protein
VHWQANEGIAKEQEMWKRWRFQCDWNGDNGGNQGWGPVGCCLCYAVLETIVTKCIRCTNGKIEDAHSIIQT